jgi:LAS seventeen-binding protein 5
VGVFSQGVLQLVNPQMDSIKTNVRVQECLEKAKLVRKQIVRYIQVNEVLDRRRIFLINLIQLVENEEIIGTLIETNERIIAALEMYDKVIFNPNTLI